MAISKIEIREDLLKEELTEMIQRANFLYNDLKNCVIGRKEVEEYLEKSKEYEFLIKLFNNLNISNWLNEENIYITNIDIEIVK